MKFKKQKRDEKHKKEKKIEKTNKKRKPRIFFVHEPSGRLPKRKQGWMDRP